MKWLALIAFLASPAWADERVGSFLLPDAYPNAIVLYGDITVRASLEFRLARLYRPDADLLILHSAGGDTTHAIEIGYEIQALGMATWVMPDAYCSSACAFMFFAGSPRTMDGELSVHQPLYPSEASKRYIRHALSKFGAPDAVFDALWATAQPDIHVFTLGELEALGLR